MTVFGGAEGIPADDEARAIWKKVTGFGDDRIIGILGMPGDNFWQMGDTGPVRPVHRDPLLHRRRRADARDVRRGADAPTARAGWRSGTSSSCSSTARTKDGGGYDAHAAPEAVRRHRRGPRARDERAPGQDDATTTPISCARSSRRPRRSAGKPYRGIAGRRRRLDARHRRSRAPHGVPHRRGHLPGSRRAPVRAPPRDAPRDPSRPPPRHRASRSSTRSRSRWSTRWATRIPSSVERKDLIASVAEQEEVRFRETIDRGLKILDEEVGRADEQRRHDASPATPSSSSTTRTASRSTSPRSSRASATSRSTSPRYERAMAEQKARSEGFKIGRRGRRRLPQGARRAP